MTFSIIGFDEKNGDLGVAVQSKFISVGSAVPWAQSEIGAVATQAYADISFGPRGLELLKKGVHPNDIITELLKDDPKKELRQLSVMNAKGDHATFTGRHCFYYAGHLSGKNYTCQGNILTGESTLTAMAESFEQTNGDLIDKLLASLSAVDQPHLGDARGQQSAALLVVRKEGGYGGTSDRMVDLRVDDHSTPIKELRRIFSLHDMIFLKRETHRNLHELTPEDEQTVKSILVSLKYMDENLIHTEWSDLHEESLKRWHSMNNFENKYHGKKTMWKSVLDYMKFSKGSKNHTFKTMAEFRGESK